MVSNRAAADTELTGKIISYNKNIINRNQLNEVREAETTLGVEVVWRDLRSGEILSRPRPRDGPSLNVPSLPTSVVNPAEGLPLPPVTPPPPAVPPPGSPTPPPVLIQSIGGFIPELGQSLTTAQQQNVQRLAIQIVSMMETPW